MPSQTRSADTAGPQATTPLTARALLLLLDVLRRVPNVEVLVGSDQRLALGAYRLVPSVESYARRFIGLQRYVGQQAVLLSLQQFQFLVELVDLLLELLDLLVDRCHSVGYRLGHLIKEDLPGLRFPLVHISVGIAPRHGRQADL